MEPIPSNENIFEDLLLGKQEARKPKKSDDEWINEVFGSFDKLQEKTSEFIHEVELSKDNTMQQSKKVLLLGKAYSAFKSSLDNYTKLLDSILNTPLNDRLKVFTETSKLKWLKNISNELYNLGDFNLKNLKNFEKFSNLVKASTGFVKDEIELDKKLNDIWKKKSWKEDDELPPSSLMNTKFTKRGTEEENKFDAEYWKRKKNQ